MLSAVFRWIIDPPADGVTNMARDEALLRRVGSGDSPPTLRFYHWDPPTISLGYFQPYAQYASLPPPAGGLAVVRRQTGGGAILHDLELTYSITLPLDHPMIRDRNPNFLYEQVHSAVAAMLARFNVNVARGPESGPCTHRGPFFCFERHCCFDLLIEGRKIMGSAQRRTAQAVLQHGSLILDSRFPQQDCATVADYAAIDIDSLLPELAAAIVGVPFGPPATFDDAENELTQELRGKYADPAWTQRR